MSTPDNDNVVPLFNSSPAQLPARPVASTGAGPAEIDTRALTYTVVQVAAMLSLSRGSAYEYVRNGTIPAMRLGRRWVVPCKRFHAWLDNLPEG